MSSLQAIPTNIITGFLGVGKTTAILHLLAQKPGNERWAVLVNEFGEVGIDGSLVNGQQGGDGVFIRELPGGCMCCTAGLPMQIALNRLLSEARPQRLLIEPTGLGHPEEIVALLGDSFYRDVLDLHATLTLVDARKVSDPRYSNHPTFRQQLDVADIIVANKSDGYDHDDLPALHAFLATTGNSAKPVYPVTGGALNPDWLQAPGNSRNAHRHHHHGDSAETGPAETAQAVGRELPAEGFLCIDNSGEGFYSRGWIFTPDWLFDAEKLTALLMGVAAERLKAVFITPQGIMGFNKADDVLTETELDDSMDSRIECITADPAVLENLQQGLLACAVTGAR